MNVRQIFFLSKAPSIKKILLTLALSIYYVNLFAAGLDNPGNSFFSKPSEFELERMAPRSELEVLSNNLAGENISLADGGISFSIKDISIPTNMGISVDIARRYARLQGGNDKEAATFGDWHIDLPKIEFTGLIGDRRSTPNLDSLSACSKLLNPGPISAALGQIVEQYEYWNGANLSIPGTGGGKILDGINGKFDSDYITKNNIRIFCMTENSGKEYFSVQTPDGLTYKISERKEVNGESLVKNYKAAARKKIYYFVSEVADRFGSKLTYHYNDDVVLSSISLKEVDKNEVTLVSTELTNGKITKISAMGKTWTYQYSGNNLNKVVLPDSRYWEYNFPTFSQYMVLVQPDPSKNLPNLTCDFVSSTQGQDEFTLSVKHPQGADVTFDIGINILGRTEMPYPSMLSDGGYAFYNINGCYGTFGVKSKTINFGTAENYVWTYETANNGIHWTDYVRGQRQNSPNYDAWNADSALDGTKESYCDASDECSQIPLTFGFDRLDLRVNTVTNPDGSYTRYYVSKRWDFTENSLVAVDLYDSEGNLARRQLKTFSQSEAYGISHIADPFPNANLQTIESNIYEDKIVTIQDGTSFVTENLARNVYGVVSTYSEYNDTDLSKKRYSHTTFLHDTRNWILNMPVGHYLSSDNSFSTPYREQTYYSSEHKYSSLAHQLKIMGDAQVSNTEYYANGRLKKLAQVNGPYYEEYGEYIYGKSKSVTLPCSETNACNSANGSTANTIISKFEINQDGSYHSTTDFAGNKVTYSYDGVGRLTGIDIDDTDFNDTVIAYTTVSNDGGGLGSSRIKAGFLKATLTKGNFKQQIFYDQMMRPIVVASEDENVSGSLNFVSTDYNFKNQRIFVGNKSVNVDSDDGFNFTYDVLGRKLTEVRTSDGGETSYSYLNGVSVRETDRKGNQTTTTYEKYGSTQSSHVSYISSPEGVVTDIAYNIYGQVTAVTQNGIEESRGYDSKFNLETITRPETGTITYSYNSSRQVRTKTLHSGDVVSFVYNNQNAVSGETYSSGYTKQFLYDESGRIKQLTTPEVTTLYNYNELGAVDNERITISGNTFSISYEFDANGFVDTITYPSGNRVAITNNALGQPVSIGDFAKNVAYHPNGQIYHFRYGNGLTYYQYLNDEMLPYSISVEDTLYLSYSYDLNDNLTGLFDAYRPTYSLSNFEYDDLDRLRSLDGNWGTSEFNYDELGNITSRSSGGLSLTYDYNTRNQLSSVTGTYNYTFTYDDNGNVSNNGRNSLLYNDAGLLTSAGSENYTYDGNGRRTGVSKSSGTFYSIYNHEGKLFYTKNNTSLEQKDYIYLGAKLIATVEQNNLSAPIFTSSADSTNGNISLAWKAVQGATEYLIEERSSNGSWSKRYSGAQFQWSASNYNNGTYTFRVSACNSTGCGGFTHTSLTVLLPPATPSTITVPASSVNGSYSISWSSVSTAANYILQEQLNGGSWTTLSSNAGTPYSRSGRNSAKYTYRVAACNASGCSNYKTSSTLINVNAPGNISYSANDFDGTVAISWASVPNISKYQLEKYASGRWSKIYEGSSTSANATGLGNTSYKFRVRACISTLCSNYKTGGNTTIVLPPSSITVPSSAVNGSFLISWSGVATASKYTLQERVNSGSWTTLSSKLTATTYTRSGRGNAKYTYRIAACNAYGCSGYKTSSAVTNVNAPGSLSYASNDYDGTLAISWASVANISKYQLEKYATGSWTKIYEGTSTSANATGLGNGAYKFRVRACISTLCSSYKTGGNSIIVLPPSSISVPSTSVNGTIVLSWAGVSTSTYYKVQEKAGSGSWSTVTSSVTSTSLSRTGRSNQKYQYRVAACNASGCSGYRTSGDAYNINRPGNIPYASKDHDGSFTVSWSGVSYSTSYQLQRYNGGWSTVYSGTAKSKSFSNVPDGKYKFRVRACRGNTCTSYRTGGEIWEIRPNLSVVADPVVLINPGNITFTWRAIGGDYCENWFIGRNAVSSGFKTIAVMGTSTETFTCHFGDQTISVDKKVIVKYGGGNGPLSSEETM